MRDRIAAEEYHRRTGKPLDVTSSVPRMLWIARHEPDVFSRAKRWVDVGSFLLERLTGRFCTCVAGADTSGLVGLAARSWDEELLAAARMSSAWMPGLLEPGSVVGALIPSAAAELELPAGLPVVAAGGDGQALALGSGIEAFGGWSLTLGTSVILGAASSQPLFSSLFRTLISSRPGRHYLLESVLQSGTHLLEWYREQLSSPEEQDLADMEHAVDGIAPGCDGLVTVPNWWGTRFPESHPEARGATFGWSPLHTRTHLYRSLLEGIAFELKRLASGFSAALPQPPRQRVAASGGGSRSASWLRIICDVLGLPVVLPREKEAAALGAAMLAACATGMFASAAEASSTMVGTAGQIEPGLDAVRRFEEIYTSLYLPLLSASLSLSEATGSGRM